MEMAALAARAGGRVLTERARDFGSVRVKSSAADVVSEADIDSGVAVVSAIAEGDPHARFVVEEDEVYDLAGVGRGSFGDDEVWVVDPLDGTTSFVHGYPCYTVSVALLRAGRPVAGAVYDPLHDELFLAARGEGATRNGSPIRCSDHPTIEGALLATGFPYDRGETLDRQLALFGRLVRPSHDVRRDGSAAMDCCHVACGRCDGFWELALHPWDTAAGVVVLEEAGGVFTDFAARPWEPESIDVIAANPRLHAELLRVVREVEGS